MLQFISILIKDWIESSPNTGDLYKKNFKLKHKTDKH
jgi:hypothetical protein